MLARLRRSWRRSAGGAENLYERVRASMFLHAIYRYRLQEASEIAGRRGTSRTRGFEDLIEPPVRAGDRRVPGRPAARAVPSSADCQRPGPGLRADHLSDPRRPGPAIGPQLPGQPLDVPRRPRRRAPARASSRPAGARRRRRPVPDPRRADARFGSTSRTAAGPTSSSWAWTTPKGPGS